MSNKISQIGRVAFRVEGENWNAYWALPDTMKGALFIASTKFAIVENPARKEQFMQYVRDGIDDLFFEHWGVRPTWPGPVPAPEQERTRE